MQTLADLLECFQLYAVCSDCQRMERLALAQLARKLGSDLTIDSLRRRLRCTRCRLRTGDIRIVYVGKQARLAGFHYRGNPAADQPLSNSVDSSVKPNPSTPT